MCWNTEPYQELVDKKECLYCGEESNNDFCSKGCSKAYFND